MDFVAMGARIRDARISRGWTQETLANKSGISTSFLGHVERGTRKTSVENFINILNALELSADCILIDSLSVPDPLPQRNGRAEMTLLH